MKLKTELLNYQKEAFDKLSKVKVGALYMEMGTGKTRTALELIYTRMRTKKINTILWLCPCSIKNDIKTNIELHSDGMIENICIYGIESLSQSDRTYLKVLDIVRNSNVFLVIDESNLVKNYFAKRTKRIIEISKSCEYRLILNGTPISRNEIDLFSQWFILDKRILGYGSYYSFAANHIELDEYGKPCRCLNVDYLSRKIENYSYSCAKEDCFELLPKRYCDFEFFLNFWQEVHYEEVKDYLLSRINEFDVTTIFKLFTGLQLVCSGRRIVEMNHFKTVPFFKNPLDNPRIKTLLEAISCHDEYNEKVIIWCKYKHEIDDIKNVLMDEYGQDNITEFHGGITLKKRIEQLKTFRDSARFLIGTKACGGYGLNLQFCNNMIYYSNDFNWATRVQSEDRVHRLGQTKEVEIIDILACCKVDMRIRKNLESKESLADEFKELLKQKNVLSKWIDGVGV